MSQTPDSPSLSEAHLATEGLDTLVVESSALGGQAGNSRRIENYLGFPAGISGSELTGRAVMQARKFGARPASPYRAVALEPGESGHLVRLAEGHEITASAVLLATGAQYRRLDVQGLSDYEGLSVFYAAGPREQVLCGASRVAVIGGGNSAGQAAVWLARGGALVTLLHRRADLDETMSHYLVRELERYGVAVRDLSEIAQLHGQDGQLEAVTLTSGERLPFSYLFRRGRRPTRAAGNSRRAALASSGDPSAYGQPNGRAVLRCLSSGERADPAVRLLPVGNGDPRPARRAGEPRRRAAAARRRLTAASAPKTRKPIPNDQPSDS